MSHDAPQDQRSADLEWLHRFINCTPFGADAPASDIQRAHEIVSALSERGTSALSKDDLIRAAIACEQIWAMDLGERLREAAEGGDDVRDVLLRCREEFCWHGNTGNRLSVDMYSQLVDMIDKVLHAAPEGK